MDVVDKTSIEVSMATTGVVGASDTIVKLDFGLNEGFSMEETNQDDTTTSTLSMHISKCFRCPYIRIQWVSNVN